MDFLGGYGSEEDKNDLRMDDDEEEIIVHDVEDDSSNDDSSSADSILIAGEEEDEVVCGGEMSYFGSDLEYIAQQVQSIEPQTISPHLQEEEQDDDDEQEDEDMNEDGPNKDENADDISVSSDDTEDILLHDRKQFKGKSNTGNMGIDDSDEEGDDMDELDLTEEEAQLGAATEPPKTQHELDENTALLPLPAAPEVLQLLLGAKKDQLRMAGEVLYRIDHEQTVVIQGILSSPQSSDTAVEGSLSSSQQQKLKSHPETSSSLSYSLNEGTVLCTAEGIIVGVIHEVFGPVTAPFYIVRYRGYMSNSAQKKTVDPDNKNKANNKRNKNNKKKGKKGGKASDGEIALETVAEENKEDSNADVEGEEDVNAKTMVVDEEKEESKASATITASQAVNAHFVQQEKQPTNNSQDRTLREIPSIIQPGVLVFTAPDHSVFLTPQLLRNLRTLKGSDASNAYDEEVGDDEIEYSDDEEEKIAKKAAKDKLKREKQQQTQPNHLNSDQYDAIPSGHHPQRRRVVLPNHMRNAPAPTNQSTPNNTSHFTQQSSYAASSAPPIHVPIEHFLQPFPAATPSPPAAYPSYPPQPPHPAAPYGYPPQQQFPQQHFPYAQPQQQQPPYTAHHPYHPSHHHQQPPPPPSNPPILLTTAYHHQAPLPGIVYPPVATAHYPLYQHKPLQLPQNSSTAGHNPPYPPSHH